MSQATHTPGEWWAGSDDDAHMVYGPNNEYIADCGRDDGDTQAEEANAHLIAAVPDLLAACRQAEPCIDTTAKGGQLALDMIRAAIAKAEPHHAPPAPSEPAKPLLPEPDSNGCYRYADGCAIYEHPKFAGVWTAQHSDQRMLRADNNLVSYFNTPEDAARALLARGEGPAKQ